VLGQDHPELIEDLVRYGSDEIYEKLRWLDKVTALEIACSLNPTYQQRLLDKLACDVLLSEYQDIGNGATTSTILQLMGVFHHLKYSRQELWMKLTVIVSGLYDQEIAQLRK
jgi:hypothetical protein